MIVHFLFLPEPAASTQRDNHASADGTGRLPALDPSISVVSSDPAEIVQSGCWPLGRVAGEWLTRTMACSAQVVSRP